MVGNKGCFYKLGSAKYATCFLYKENNHNIQWKLLLSGLPAQIHLLGPFTTHWVLLKWEFLDTVLFLPIFELKCSLERQSINTHPCFEWLWGHPGEVNFTLILFATLEGSPTTIQWWLLPPWYMQCFLLCLLQCKNEFSEKKNST